jgi:hypothetical protein
MTMPRCSMQLTQVAPADKDFTQRAKHGFCEVLSLNGSLS